MCIRCVMPSQGAKNRTAGSECHVLPAARLWNCAVGALLLLLTGCVGTTIEDIPAERDQDARGVRFYNSAPFVLVTSDRRGSLTSQFMYLPDTTRLLGARPYAFMGVNKTTLTFKNGVLESAKVTTDDTAVPKAIVAAVEAAATAAAKAFLDQGGVAADTGVPPPILLRVVFLGDGSVKLKGGVAVGPDGKEIKQINVTMSKAALAGGSR